MQGCLPRDFPVSAAYPGVDRKPDRSEFSRHHCMGPGGGTVRNLLPLCPVFFCPWKMLALKGSPELLRALMHIKSYSALGPLQYPVPRVQILLQAL